MMSLLLMLLGCSGPRYECSESIACDLGSVCVAGTCQAQGCATSDQCGIQQYCGDDRQCHDGCAADTDCKYGEFCDQTAATCVTAECSDAHVDCSFGEFCSPAGECYQSAGYYCKSCNDDKECGGGGNLCIGGYCGVTCVADRDCPSGYQCQPFQDINGNVIANQCWTSCWLYE